MAKGHRKETRSEHQRFLAGLQGRSADERERLQKEHKAYLAGERDQDVDFDKEPAPTLPTRRPALHRPPPLGKDFAYLQAQKRLISQQRRAVAAKTVAGSGRKAPVARKTKEQDEDYVPDEEKDFTPPRKKQKGARSTVSKKKDVAAKKKAVAKTNKTAAATKKAATKKAAPKKPRNSSNAKAKEKEAKTAAAVQRCIASASAEVEGAIAHKAARERLNNQLRNSTDAANTTDDGASALTDRMATTHQSVPADQQAEESGQPEVGADPPSPSPVQHDQSPTSQEKDDTTSQRVTSTEDLLEIRDPSVERAQPNAPVVRLPADESIPASTTGSGFLDSDCEDTETEICFLDDDDELERARCETTGLSTADESSLLSDSEAESTLDDDADSNDQDCLETLVDSYPPRAWNVLPKHEMVDFAKDPNNMAEMRASGWTLDAAEFPPDERYPDLYTGLYGPTDEVVALADSPLKLFLFFMPKDFWVKVAAESHRYFLQNLTTRVDRMFDKQKTPNKKSKEEFMDKESKKPEIKPHEILHVLGLLLARMLNPQRRRFRDHWSKTAVGAVARGTFNDYMPRHRFEHIMTNLHFTNNADTQAVTDRAWKVRSAIQILQDTFPRGYKTPPVISFDEGIIPSRNRNNPTRQYLKAKPHKWGTKMFLTCCADTAYCMRLEVYCGSAQTIHEIGNVPENQLSADPNTGPSSVIRNLEAVLPAPKDNVYHLVVTDRFYTSVQLAFQLLSRNVYSIGTIMGDRVGYPQEIVERSRDRPKGVPHGTVQMAVAKNCPQMTGLMWWDRKPVQVLGTGSNRALETCQRRTRGSKGKRQDVPCPSMFRDYHRWMGGVDIHDQLRLQRYSLQLQTWCKKYYKTIFMGLVDVAIVNAYIVFREAQKRSDARPISHAEFLLKLHADMLDLDERSFTDRAPPTDIDSETFVPMVGHEAQESPDYQIVNGVRKRRQRLCKVCSLLKRRIGERRATKYYCPTCSPSEKARTYLCQKVWKHFPGNTMTCSQIWHYKWENGTKRPAPRCGRDIQSRAAGGGGGARAAGKRKRQRLVEESDSGDEEGAEGQIEGELGDEHLEGE